ncbi:MAG: hypothetical protein QNJ47_00540 [Nostocaceae cyanobacterium]|nr:hypothetical protein [Nostocaceae cyanobacterium]
MVKGLSGMFLGLVLIGFGTSVVASEGLQTEITEKDLQIIDQLVRIAEKNSYQVREAKSTMGVNAFLDVVSIELSPSQSSTKYRTPDFYSEDERSFSVSLTIDPIKIFSTINQIPVMEGRLREIKQQTRLAVIKRYLAYLQARQASKIAAYRMQKFPEGERIASNVSLGSSQQLHNADYVVAATHMLNKNAEEKIALEELAAAVGLSSQEMINVLHGGD